MKVIISLSFLLLLCFSCKKKSDPEPQEFSPDLKGLIKSITISSGSLTEKYDYEYMDSLTLKSITHQNGERIITEFFEYKDDTLRYSYKGDTTKSYFHNGYQAKGKLAEVHTRHSKNAEFYHQSRLLYYSPSVKPYIFTRKKIGWEPTEWGVKGYVDYFLSELEIYWDGPNVHRLYENLSSWNFINTIYRYDENKNPLYDLYSKVLRIPTEGTEGLSMNNIAEFSNTIMMGAVSTENHYKIEGEYNSKMYPIQRSLLKKVNDKDEWVVIARYHYEYYE